MSGSRPRDNAPRDSFQQTVATGGAIGAAAYLLNYVLIYLFVTIDGVETGRTATWKIVGQTLYNAQFVSTAYSTPDRTETVNFVTESTSYDRLAAAVTGTPIGETVPTLAYHLAPIVVLVAAGALAARAAAPHLDTASAAAAGATIAVGTIVLSVVGVFLFDTGPGDEFSVAPDLAMGLVLVGVLIPVIAGAIGGALAEQV